MKKLLMLGLLGISGFVWARNTAPPVMKLETVDITLNIESKFKCGSPFVGKWFSTINCKAFDSDTGADLEVTVVRPKASSKISRFEARVMGANRTAATWVLPYLASAPIEGGFPDKAKNWTSQNWKLVKTGKPKNIVLGSTKYELLLASKFHVELIVQHKDFAKWSANALK